MVQTAADLSKRDYVLIVDKSGSMAKADCNGKSRWEASKESAFGLASKCAQFDSDGIDLYVFNHKFKKYPNTTPEKVEQIFTENEADGSTALHLVLKDALDNYFANKAKPVTILVITDGEPDCQKSVVNVIVEATKKMSEDEEVGICFLQAGKDNAARDFLKRLDDELTSEGAKFDIVDAVTYEESGDKTLTEILLAAIND